MNLSVLYYGEIVQNKIFKRASLAFLVNTVLMSYSDAETTNNQLGKTDLTLSTNEQPEERDLIDLIKHLKIYKSSSHSAAPSDKEFYLIKSEESEIDTGYISNDFSWGTSNSIALLNGSLGRNVPNSIAIGESSIADKAHHSVALSDSKIGESSFYSTALNKSTIGKGSHRSAALSNSTIGEKSHQSTALSNSTIGDNAHYSFAAGWSTINKRSPGSSALGWSAIGEDSYGSFGIALSAIGSRSHRSFAASYSTIEDDSPYSFAAGEQARIYSKAEHSIVIGRKASAYKVHGIALGKEATANHANSAAIGKGAKTDKENSVSFGYKDKEDENKSFYKYLTNIAAGQDPNDAVNKKQLDQSMEDVKNNVIAELKKDMGALKNAGDAAKEINDAMVNIPQITAAADSASTVKQAAADAAKVNDPQTL
ncbi:hypothetical protein ID852_12265, partial [Xenorhabdus sp. 42]|nr:hypothetical protein [Xenorhabdus sp. 42]